VRLYCRSWCRTASVSVKIILAMLGLSKSRRGSNFLDTVWVQIRPDAAELVLNAGLI
jgi:hypothetical protein